jgi:spore maturation protein A
MLNIIWFLMIIIGIIAAFINGNPQIVTEAAFDGAVLAVETVIKMTGVIMLWMGVLNLAEKSGLVKSFGKLLYPFVGKLFPGLSKDSSAFGNIVMNISANFFGLGNAATPFGLKAMEDLQKLNSDNKKASDDMICFLILNTSAITLIPTMVISLRVESGSAAPEEILLPALIAGIAGLSAGLLLHKILKRFF